MNAIPLLAIAIAALCVFHNCSGEIPSDIKKCHAGDVKCIATTINDILRKNPNGHKGLRLPNLEPVHLDELVVSKIQPNSPLNLNLVFNDVDMYGLSTANISRVVGFEKDIRNSKFELYLTTPLLTLRGKYEANGRILLLPIVGTGDVEVKLKNFKSGIKVKLIQTKENGKLTTSISKIKVRNDPEQMTVRLDNLFNGNKALGDELNNVINTNWKDVWTELETGINGGYTQIVNFLMSDIFKAITYDDFYSD